ncbi:MAG TPA: hypothetical protein VLU47_09345, partial [Blastocatellia bacterium]|nr:hypothetical protein [Blastocatellia bacterium]
MKVNRGLSRLIGVASARFARTTVNRSRRNGRRALVSGVLALFLAMTQVMTALPVSADSRMDRARKPAPSVLVNRTPPEVDPPAAKPVFSATPTDDEIRRARVFE